MTTFNRQNEQGTFPMRTERFYQIGKEWFFAIRHGNDHGPFRSQVEARSELKRYILEQLSLEQDEEKQPQVDPFKGAVL